LVNAGKSDINFKSIPLTGIFVRIHDPECGSIGAKAANYCNTMLERKQNNDIVYAKN